MFVHEEIVNIENINGCVQVFLLHHLKLHNLELEIHGYRLFNVRSGATGAELGLVIAFGIVSAAGVIIVAASCYYSRRFDQRARSGEGGRTCAR